MASGVCVPRRPLPEGFEEGYNMNYDRKRMVTADAAGVPDAVRTALANPAVGRVEIKFYGKRENGEELWWVIPWICARTGWTEVRA